MMGTGRLGQRLRLLAGPADQAISSLTNFLVVVAVARRGSIEDFGGISALMILTTLGMLVVRSFTSDCLIAPGRQRTSEEERGFLTAVVDVGLAVGGVALLVLAPLSVVMPDAGVLIGAAIAIPLVAVQDSMRFLAFSRGTASAALGADVAWLASASVLLATVSWESDFEAFALWAAASIAGTFVALLWLRPSGEVARPNEFMRASRRAGVAFFVEYLSIGGVGALALLLIPPVASTESLAVVRGLQLLASPLAILLSGLSITLPRLVRSRAGDVCTMGDVVWLNSLVVGGFALASFALVLVPRGVGVAVLGETWDVVSAHVWLVVPYLTFGAMAAVGRTFVRLMGGERRTAPRQLALAPLVLLAPIGAAYWWGGAAAFGAVVLVSALTALVWMRETVRLVQQGGTWHIRDLGTIGSLLP